MQQLNHPLPDRPVMLLEGNAGGPACQPGQAGTVRLLSEKADEIRLAVNGLSPGWLMASITHYPGWEARLDGSPVDIYHANYLFMGIEIPAGEHELVIQYRPKSFYFGAMLSILILFWIMVLRSGRNGRPHLGTLRARMLNP